MRKFLFNRRPARINLEEYRATLSRSQLARPENDFYHWLLGTSWSSFMLLVVFVFLATNLLFAFAYIACGNGAITNARPDSLLDVFFFSVETMATIGYGRMTPVGSWPNAIVTFEAFLGIVYSALTAGLAFTRLTRPTAGVRFSEVAIVGNHEGLSNQVYARYVYLPKDVQQNTTFIDIVTALPDGDRVIDLTNFDKWVPNTSDKLAGEYL